MGRAVGPLTYKSKVMITYTILVHGPIQVQC